MWYNLLSRDVSDLSSELGSFFKDLYKGFGSYAYSACGSDVVIKLNEVKEREAQTYSVSVVAPGISDLDSVKIKQEENGKLLKIIYKSTIYPGNERGNCIVKQYLGKEVDVVEDSIKYINGIISFEIVEREREGTKVFGIKTR